MQTETQLDKHDIQLLEPLLREKRDEDLKQTMEKRRKAAVDLDVLKSQATENRLKIQEDLKAAKEEVKTSRDALREKEMAAARMEAELMSESFRTGAAVRRHETLLLETYDKRIDEALVFFKAKLDEARKIKTSTQTYKAETDVVNLRKKLTTYSNVGAIKRTMKYFQACIQEFEALKLVPEYDPARFEELKRNIPDSHQLEEFDIARPLKDSTETSWEKTLPTDSHHDWTMKKLLDKAEKLIKTPSILKRAYTQKRT